MWTSPDHSINEITHQSTACLPANSLSDSGQTGRRIKLSMAYVEYAGPYASLTLKMRIQAQTLVRKP